MKKRLQLIKRNLPIIFIGLGIIAVIIIITILFTDLNPIIIGSAVGIAMGVIIPAIIYRVNIRRINKK
jgi:hypothetical protein